jgi:hypothetical protein
VHDEASGERTESNVTDTRDKTNFERELARRLLWGLSAVFALIGLIFAVGLGLLTESYVVVLIGAVLLIVAVVVAVIAHSLRTPAMGPPR